MPAAVAAAVAGAIVSSTAVYAAVYAVTYLAVSLAISYAVGSIMGAIFKPRSQNGFAAEAQGRSQVVRSNVQPRNMIYGRVMTSGPLVFAQSTSWNGKSNNFMHLVLALADHECDAIEEVYLGEYPVGQLDAQGMPVGGRFTKTVKGSQIIRKVIPAGTTSLTFDLDVPVAKMISTVGIVPNPNSNEPADEFDYPVSWAEGSRTITVSGIGETVTELRITYETATLQPYVRIKKNLGSPDQLADPDLIADVPGWTADHRLRGICYLYVRLEFDADIFPNGLPNIKALVRGKKVLDPRYGQSSWSENYALCVYDFLRDERGFGCADDEIDVSTVIAAANISDEIVQTAEGIQNRYRCAGIVTLDKSPRDNLAEMATAGAGAIVLAGGVFRIFAGAYDVPTVTLTEDDLRGPVKVQARTSRKDLFNVVKGTFIDPTKSWQPSDFPPVRNAAYAVDDGEVIERDIELPFTTNATVAQRIAKIILERSRQGIVVEFPAKLSGFKLTAFSTVKVTLAKFGWTEKVFRVMDWKMSHDGGVDLVLNEEAPTVYDWSMGDATTVDPAPDTNLPNPYVVENMGQISAQSGEDQLIVSQSGTVISRIRLSWPAASEAALLQTGRAEFQYKLASEGAWISLPQLTAAETSTFIAPVEDGRPYNIRGRFVSALGVRSPDWSYAPVHTVVGKLQPPANMTGLSMTAMNGGANLTWDPAPDVDVRNGGQARIRHTRDLLQPSWGSAIDIGGTISGAATSAQLPLLNGVYLGKWIDSSGNESVEAAMVLTTAPSLQPLNVVALVQEDPAFVGNKVGVILDPALNGIKLVGNGLIDDQGVIDATGLWDSQPAIDGLGAIDDVIGQGGWGLIDSLGGTIDSGVCFFANSLDLGTVERCRLTAQIRSVSFDTGDAIDDRTDLVDAWQSIDGDVISDTGVALYVRTTDDNPAGAPDWSEWQRFVTGDYEARAFEWKVVLTSASPTHNILVTGLSVIVDMPDRREYAKNVVTPAGPLAVAYPKAFRADPSLGITAQNLSQGDYHVITGKTAAGFTITFFNSASTAVSRKFDWDAVGF